MTLGDIVEFGGFDLVNFVSEGKWPKGNGQKRTGKKFSLFPLNFSINFVLLDVSQ